MGNEESILICGFDLSCNSSGVCIIDEKRNIVHAESINPYPLTGIARLNYIYDRLYTVLTSYDIKVIGFEKQLQQQRYNYNAGSILPLAEVLGAFKVALYKATLNKCLNVYAFKATVLKENLTGNSKADKDLMMESLGIRKLNHLKANIVDYAVNDCTDAFSAADAALKVYKGTFSLEYQPIFLSNELIPDKID